MDLNGDQLISKYHIYLYLISGIGDFYNICLYFLFSKTY